MNRQVIPVVFATDNNYVPYCGVAISSLIANATSENLYEVYVLYDSISKVNILRLEMMSVKNVHIHCICIHDAISKLKVVEYNHLTIASAYRLVIPDVLPQYEKIIYLDSDIVVNDDVAKLFNINIGENIIGAVKGFYICEEEHFMYKHITEVLKIDKEAFFNAGILILNNVAFRENNVKEKCFELLSNRTDLIFMDQCALNIVCEGKVYFVPERWNYEWLVLFSANDVDAVVMENPAIIHYDGIEKPWNYPNMILSEIFWKYARQTIFYEEIIKNLQIKATQEVYDTFCLVEKVKNIAVYGAGNAGKRYIDKILSSKFLKLVIWVDKNYEEKRNMVFPVESPEKLYVTDFDKVIIAIENQSISYEVEQELISKGISKEKIIKI